MQLDDKITNAYLQETPIYLESVGFTLLTAANKSIKVFNLKNNTREPEIINTLDEIKSINIHSNNNKHIGVVSGGFECGIHDLTGFIYNSNSNSNDDTNNSQIVRIWKSSSKITQAIFTHGGQRICIGDLGANMIFIDISSNLSNSSNFGKVIDKIKVNGEITGLSYSYSVDLLAVTVADGGLYIYSLSSNSPERKAIVGNILVDKRLALTNELGLGDDDSDFSDLSDDNDDDDGLDINDNDSMFTETTNGLDSKKSRNKKTNLLKFASSKTVWNSVGDILAIPNKNFKIDFYNAVNWSNSIYSLFAGDNLHHKDNLTAISFSPNNKYFASISLDKLLIIWDLNTKKMIGRTIIPFIGIDINWSDDKNLSISSNNGKFLYIDESTFKQLIKPKGVTIDEDSLNKNNNNNKRKNDSDDEGDDVLESNDEENDLDDELDRPRSQDLDGFIIDDDMNDSHRYPDGDDFDSYNKRRNNDMMSESTELTDFNKRARREQNNSNNRVGTSLNIRTGWGKALTKPFSIGSTPFDGSDRRYLTISSIACVYTVKTQNTFKITVLFFDEEKHKKYFFDDLVGYDICSINDQGAVFATSGFRKNKGFIARIEYKNHQNGRSGETQWIREIKLRPYEFITSVSVYGKFIFICTNKGFVKKFNIFGRLINIYMMDCVIGIMNNNNYVFTIIKKSIESGYFFNIQNLDGDYIQQELSIPLITENDIDYNMNEIPIKTMFFSEQGEPCIVRNDGILIVLTKWRDINNKPIWKPLLDIQEGISRSGRSKELKAWPLGLFNDSFLFVPFRGSKNYPIFPLLTPMNIDIRIPINFVDPNKQKRKEIGSDIEDDDIDNEEEEDNEEDNNVENPEEKFLRTIILAEMLSDSISNNENDNNNNNNETIEKLQLLSLEYDKTLLIQLNDACSNGDSDDAFEICKLIRDLRALNAAQKISESKSMAGLARRIRNLREARMAEEEDNEMFNKDDDNDDDVY